MTELDFPRQNITIHHTMQHSLSVPNSPCFVNLKFSVTSGIRNSGFKSCLVLRVFMFGFVARNNSAGACVIIREFLFNSPTAKVIPRAQTDRKLNVESS